MKRKAWKIGLLAAAVAAAGCWFGRVPAAQAQSGQTVTWEAEGAAKLETPFAKRSGKKNDKRPKPQASSGSGYVEIPNKANGDKKEGEGSQLPGLSQYKVNVPAAGAYTLWARVLWPDGCGNSFWVQPAGRSRLLLGEDGTYDAWHWVKCDTKLALQKGVNVIDVKNREDGVILDQLQVTTSSRTPVGPVAPTSGALAN
ncbi:MAG: hypothetical protein IT204_09990 [Fimbriimonadaceae bacterium]|nr:hypothetical protein [Fimbriimonadaceae bacterium]